MRGAIRIQRGALAAAAVIGALSCSRVEAPRPGDGRAADINPAMRSIASADLTRHIRTLSSDEFEGRAPGTEGERLTVRYLIDQFKSLGLEPGHPDGTYVQNVPLVGLTAKSSMRIVSGGKTLDLRFPSDYVAVTRRIVPEVAVEESDMIFVGYGVVAPEYGWDEIGRASCRERVEIGVGEGAGGEKKKREME